MVRFAEQSMRPTVVEHVPAAFHEPHPFHSIVVPENIRDLKFTVEALDTDPVACLQAPRLNIAETVGSSGWRVDSMTLSGKSDPANRLRRDAVACRGSRLIIVERGKSGHRHIAGNSRCRPTIERYAVSGLDGSRFGWKTE